MTPDVDRGTTVLLVRHAQAVVPDEHGRYRSANAGGLSEHGVAQAERLAGRLAHLDISRIVASDMQRAAETAQIVAGHHPCIEVEFRPEFREIDCGRLNGSTVEELRIGYPAFLPWITGGFKQGFGPDGHLPVELRFPDGESIVDLSRRVIPAFTDLVTHSDGLVCLVSHAWAVNVLLCHVLSMDVANYYRFGQPNAGVCVVRVDRNGVGMLDALAWDSPPERLAGGSVPVRDTSLRDGHG